MRRFALRVDIDTIRGLVKGAPVVTEMLDELGMKATFFATVGVDRTARAFFHSSRLKRHVRISPLKKYGVWEIVGSLFGLDFSKHRQRIVNLEKKGHEVQLHCFDHVEWVREIEHADLHQTEHMIRRGIEAFESMLGRRPTAFAAPAFKTSQRVIEMEKKLGFLYASDYQVKGDCKPFTPQGGVVQIPVNLPLIEDLVAKGWSDAKILSLLSEGFAANRMSVMYIHLCYEPVHKTELLRKTLELALDKADPVTLKEIWRDWSRSG